MANVIIMYKLNSKLFRIDKEWWSVNYSCLSESQHIWIVQDLVVSRYADFKSLLLFLWRFDWSWSHLFTKMKIKQRLYFSTIILLSVDNRTTIRKIWMFYFIMMYIECSDVDSIIIISMGSVESSTYCIQGANKRKTSKKWQCELYITCSE